MKVMREVTMEKNNTTYSEKSDLKGNFKYKTVKTDLENGGVVILKYLLPCQGGTQDSTERKFEVKIIKEIEGFRKRCTKCGKVKLISEFCEGTDICRECKDSEDYALSEKTNYSENESIRTSLEYHLWRKSVLERDNFTCQKCEQNGGELEVHHINNFSEFPELRLAINNGVTLCKKCHNDFHKKYGRKNNTKEQLEKFLK